MKPNKKSDNLIIASEVYNPDLSGDYMQQYRSLLQKLANALPENRIDLIKKEISIVKENDETLENLKYTAALSVLADLSRMGWIFDFSGENLMLKMADDNLDNKTMLRRRLTVERNSQFKTASVAKFINSMESARVYDNKSLSIRILFGDPMILLKKIHNNERVCNPYIQMATEKRDKYTGYKLLDIWRYFRYMWSIPYNPSPGRKTRYLVRDSLQPYHPVIGIFALGNSALNMTVRDNDIGWTIEAIKKEMEIKTSVYYCEQNMDGVSEKKVKVMATKLLETKEEYEKRTSDYAERMYLLLLKNINEAIDDLYVKDLGYSHRIRNLNQEKIDELLKTADEYSRKAINNKRKGNASNWKEEAKTDLYKKKRASELAKLLSTQMIFNNVEGMTYKQKLENLLSNPKGRKAINTALIANRKCKIGSNMMDIVVCGSIPPYNELLGGKLVSMLACSPIVIRDYTKKYKRKVSEIASSMKGEKVIRDSRLVYLATTSLYAMGSSQYNRIKVPLDRGGSIEFKRIGKTEGLSTVFFSGETTNLLSRILELQDGGKRFNNVYGEGTSPRFRMIKKGLAAIGLKPDAFLNHYSPKIVYTIDLAINTKRFLLGLDDNVDYGYDLSDDKVINQKTQEIIEYWYRRWLEKRLTTVNIEERLSAFRLSDYLLGNISV